MNTQNKTPFNTQEGKMNEVINTGIKYCNYWSIFTNIIVSLVCIIALILLNKESDLYEPVEGIVVSLVNDKCESSLETVVDSQGVTKTKSRYTCDLTIKYVINGTEYQQSLVSDTYTRYGVGSKVEIEYLKTDTSVIRFRVSHVVDILTICAYVILIISILSTLIRIFLSDKRLVKWWIGITCFRNLTD